MFLMKLIEPILCFLLASWFYKKQQRLADEMASLKPVTYLLHCNSHSSNLTYGQLVIIYISFHEFD